MASFDESVRTTFTADELDIPARRMSTNELVEFAIHVLKERITTGAMKMRRDPRTGLQLLVARSMFENDALRQEFQHELQSRTDDVHVGHGFSVSGEYVFALTRSR
jgi:hypothetical protein